jgi:hypothetical protein
MTTIRNILRAIRLAVARRLAPLQVPEVYSVDLTMECRVL